METARVYVGTWKKYNNGNLAGAWLDLTKYVNYQEFLKACYNLHSDESDPELMIQDAELPDGHSLSSNEWLYEDDFNDIIQEIKDSEKEDEENLEEQTAEFQIIEYSEKAIAVIGNTVKIKDNLKKLGGKFNSHLKCGPGWIFSKKSESKLKDLLNVNTNQNQTLVKQDKELFERYIEEMRKEWSDERMIEHYRKTTSYVCQLSNGGLLAFEKQSIETSFCFGYSYTHDQNDYKDANKMVEHAKTNEDYFIERNLEQFDWKLEKINKEDADIYIFRKHSRSNANVYDFYVLDFYEVNANYYKHLNLQKASEEDKNIIINAIKAERAKFEKRLRTYLKKYGLSKVRSWTFWKDE